MSEFLPDELTCGWVNWVLMNVCSSCFDNCILCSTCSSWVTSNSYYKLLYMQSLCNPLSVMWNEINRRYWSVCNLTFSAAMSVCRSCQVTCCCTVLRASSQYRQWSTRHVSIASCVQLVPPSLSAAPSVSLPFTGPPTGKRPDPPTLAITFVYCCWSVDFS